MSRRFFPTVTRFFSATFRVSSAAIPTLRTAARQFPAASLAILAALAVTVVGPRTASAQCRYSAETFRGPNDPILGPVPTVLTGVNDLDQAVGYYGFAGGAETGFVWSEETGMVTLPRVPGGVRPQDINDAGQITGSMGSSPGRGFLWDGEQYIDLGIPDGGHFNNPAAINSDAVIVGWWGGGLGNPAQEAFVWRDGVMTRLGPLLGADSSKGWDINNAGQLCGSFEDFLAPGVRAFLVDDGAVVELGVAPGCATSAARALNSAGNACGFGFSVPPGEPDFRRCGFAWIGEEMIDIPPLPGFRDNDASDIDNSDTVIGYSRIPITLGFLYRNGIVTELDTLIDSPVRIRVIPSAINNNGVIVGSGNRGATVLTPIVRPGDLNRDCQVDLFDLAVLLSNFGCRQGCGGDVNGDGKVDLEDLGIMLANWGV